jgi:GT2 family glycosyltransferase
MKLTISIVTFNNEDVIEKALASIRQSSLAPDEYRVVVVDNDSRDHTPRIVESGFPGFTLIRSANTGFAAGHNKAIAAALEKFPAAAYHLVMNPDIYFDSPALERLIDFMDSRPDVGLAMPKILYPGEDQRIQHLCKRLPTPLDSIGRRFIPGFLKNLPLIKKRFDRYEFRDRDYNKIMEVPHLSGCFMMLRREVFETVGYFDERFFMYLEDVDFSRRIHRRFKTVYYPEVSIYHQYRKGSYKQFRHLKYHIVSAIKYFNKWGWFFDRERRKINAA